MKASDTDGHGPVAHPRPREPSPPEPPRDPPSPHILLVDDDDAFRRSTAELLRGDGFDVTTASGAAEASRALETRTFDLLLLDVRMPGVGGLDIVEVLRRRGERMPILMVSGYGTISTAVGSLHLGADDFLTKPVDPAELSRRIADLVDRRPVPERLDEATHHGIVGRSKNIREMIAAIRQVAPTDATVLVTGETGSGKELVARAVHDLSARAAHPFLPVNCAALAEGLLESELFGHVRGAFTGAVSDKDGLFAAAAGGTVFLDEIGDMSQRLQQRILRVLEEREATPVGATAPRPVDVRIVAATHRDLEREMEAGRFRRDLYYRLAVFPIRVPSLRERSCDIALLANTALERLRERSAGPTAPGISPAAVRLLQHHAWPGNVRELFAAVEAAAIRAGEGEIGVEHLPSVIRREEGEVGTGRYSETGDEEEERASILAALEAAGGVRAHAAAMLGMSRTTLWRRLRAYGIDSDSDSGEGAERDRRA